VLGGIMMTLLGWRRWADLMVDYGNQLYIPWQITEGQVLYKDLFYVFGPLSPYLHAGIFHLFGPGAVYLIGFNLAITACLTVMIYRIFLRHGGPLTATLTALTFLTVHALGQHKLVGNYNFIQPYSYDLTHGIFLSFLAIQIFSLYTQEPKTRRLMALGFVLGGVLLTKIEIIVALFPAMALGLILFFRSRNLPFSSWCKNILWVTAAGLVPFGLFVIYFSFHMPLSEALHNLILPWILAMNTKLHGLPYVQILKGTFWLENSLWRIVTYTFVLFIIVATLTGINIKLNQLGKNNFWSLFLLCSMMVALILLFFKTIPWKLFLVPLPVLMIFLLLVIIWNIKSHFQPGEKLNRNLFLLVLTVFAFLLLFKIFFRVVVFHYGFALSLPASLLAIYLIVNVFPHIFKRYVNPDRFYRYSAGVLIVCYIGALNFDSYRHFSRKTFPVGEGHDLVYDFHPESGISKETPYVKGMMLKFSLEFITKNIEPDATLVAIPDAMMVNYLSRHRDSAKGFLLNPMTWVLFNEGRGYLDDLKAHPPRYIMLIDRSFPEFNMSFFGKDYGEDIYNWIQQEFVLFKQIGPTPFTGSGFGIQFYKLKSYSKESSTIQQ